MTTKIFDTVYAVRFIRLMQKPFSEWKAFQYGIIDDTGNLIKRPKGPIEKGAYTPFHASIRAMKRMMSTIPGLTSMSTLASSWATVADRYSLSEHEHMIFKELPLFEEMIAGDSTGSVENIATGKTSGSVVNKGPEVLSKTLVKKKKKESK